MVVSRIQSFLTRQLLRYRSKLRTLLSQPIRRVLGRTKTNVKLANKSGFICTLPSKTPKLSRRKRATPNGYSSKSAMITPKRKVNHDRLRNKGRVPKRTSFEPVLTMSVTDFYRATERAISKSPHKDVTKEDKAILEKLRRASFKHEVIAGVKAVEKQMDNHNINVEAASTRRTKEHEIIARQLFDEDDKRARLVVMQEHKEKLRMKKLKDYLGKVVQAARRGEKSDTAPSIDVANMWSHYESKWKKILSGKTTTLISFDEFPWPTLNPNGLEVEDYEEFLFSPLRPGYEKLYWYERVDQERVLWDARHIEGEVVPFVKEELRDQVVGAGQVIRGYLDTIIEKYNAPD
ncbi:hypothetical protein E1B28_003628 [Marasmius oreades]|uniref:Uncharacterized protein n=1 Tax=Marasmius oreades TaxID=181124 RepID=A0A9P7RM06_9AGAR|nr:uncharacterized protein E1B28_003628 [Marasmius oreades]KAG7086114.1 hypothetical protein E1B28_003628 [Marasmius oreades]